ncbi:dynein axonemal heavy chain 7-like [Leptinotarsa decemlineata]|uniref:dynein axonemal heavy chain 7-like n=1 Tax=Leptinotarsa decemlineata TaxID=7539 RepID=UPI003D30AE1D
MSRFQEMDIRKKIQARGFEKKYPQLLSDMMKETKQQFVKIVHYAGMNLKVKSCHPEAIFTIEPYKFVVMTIGELKYAFKDKTQRASQFVYEFYLKISALVENEEAKEKKRINSRNYLEACTGLFSLHISKIIAHTILNIVNVTSCDSINPYLSLEVSFVGGLVLEPTAEEVIKCYHKFIDTVIETGTEIYVLQRNSMKGCENKYMRLYLTKEFIHECKENIKMNISKHYEPILNHLEDLNEKFDVIYTDINSEDFLESISDIKFEEGCKKINYYRKYLHKVMFIPDHEFFKIGRISLTNYREVLHEGLKENITSIFGKLCAQHFWEVNDLCENFEMIEIRANQKPVTTEELIETGKYMTWIKNEHLPELNLRVQGSLLSLCKIIDLGTLTDEHMELNSTAIKWLDKIIPIIDEHSTTFDTLKFDAEEKLQKVVEDVNDMIKDIYPLLVVLDDMDDISRAKNYLNGITLHMTKIKDIEIKIMWINKEEVSLSFPKSTYSEYEDLKNHIYPFYHLLKLCLEVQRNLSVWQDGPFEMLNYESTSSAVENFHKELTDLYKVYRKKLRQAQDDNVTLRFKGTVDDPDILNWPAPLKLCGTALKLIENFKPSVKVMRIICNPTLSKRHWKAMSEIAGKNVTPNAGTTLRNIMQIDFQSQLSEYEIISTGASKEKQLKDDLEQLKAQWYNIRFTITKQEDISLEILTDLEEIEAVVDDHNIKVLSMRRSVFVKPHDTEVKAFYGQIQKIRSTIDYWNEAQTKLLKLFPIFSSEDIKVILPKESELFLKTLKIFKYYVSLISEELLVMKIVNTTDITQKIKECLTDSEIVNQGVTVYLEVLRQSFPRLYFLGNDEMSQIISNKNLKSIQFLNRLFPGIQRLHSKDSSVIGVANSDSEVLEFLESIQINQDSSMEKFCSSVEEQIKKSLKTQMVDCYETFKTVKLKKLLSLYCSQILEVISQTYWTEYIDSALELTNDIKLKMYQQKLENALKDKLVLSDDCLTNLERIKLRGLIVNDISNKNMMILDEVDEIVNRKDEDSRNLSTWIQATIIQAGMLGLGAILDNTSKHKFDEFYKLLWKGQNENNPHPKTLEKLDVGIPHEGLIYDYYYIYKQRGNWKLYQDILKTEKIVESRYMNTFLVPTIDTLRCHSLLDKFVKKNENILFVGPSGSGKSILIEDALMNKFDKSKYEILQVNFNVNLQSHVLQRHILSKLNKIKTGVFIPQSGKNFISFIDNINLVSTNGFGNCLELLRQHSDHKIWYDFSYGNEILVSNINLISVMGLPEGSKTKLDPRLLRHFNIFAINELSEDTITRIYSNSLLHTWRKVGFPSDIANVVNQIIQATFSIYRKVKLCCRATLSRSHYVFNTSSFSKVILGCSMLRKEIYDCNKKIYLKLWAHEVMRVFGDRLTSLDSIWLQARIKEAIKVDFGESFDEHFESNGCLPNELIFSTINDCDNRNGKRYEEITDQKTLIEKCVEVLKVYNDCHEIKLEIILFQNALEKLLRITRVLSISPGNALLIGPCGSGRRNLTKLACFLYKYKLFEPVITQGYSHQDWNKEIKLVLKESGALEHQCVFLVTEEQLIDDTFLQNIDLLLQNGEVPDLYDMEERQEILELARLSAQGGNRNLEITSSAVFDFFNKRSKENLHLIICLSSVGSLLRKRIRNYPNLIDCHVIWWDDWPDDSLQQIANTWTANLDLQPEIKQKVIDVFIYCHRDSQNNYKQMLDQCHTTIYVTPVSFTHLLKLFIELMTKKQNEMAVKKKLYLTGLAKLSYAARQISDMQRALAEYQPQLAEMTQKATDMTKQIALETIEVEKASALVRKDEEVASEQAIVAQNLKMECESELAQAIPILEDAISALNTLKPSDITLVKSMKNPPDAIKLVMAAVCVIKDVKPDRIPDPSTGRKTIDYWGPSKRILGDMNFLQTLKDFDKDHIKPEIMVKIRKEYLPHKDFKPHVVAKASSAAEGLCKWIIAMDMYDKVAKEVAPKKEKLEKAEREYAETMTILNQKKDEVKRIEEKLASLKELLDDATEKQLKLQREVDACNKKLGSAQGLIGSLSGEKIRWTKSVENLANQENLLPGNILISSAIIAYLPALDNKFRKDVIQKWHQHISTLVSCSEDFNIIKSLSSDTETETWVRNGLPHDEFCFQNGVIHNFSKLYSLFIDPEYIGEKWIRKVEKRNNLIVTKFTHDDYLQKLKSCIVLGKPIMIHKIKETFPPCLNQLITKHQYIQNGNTFLILNNEHIEIDTNFKLYFVCNMSKPQFAPELCNNITLINFAITHDGMSQCLLKIVTEIEKPELKKKRKELHKKKMKNRADLLEHENNILTTLCESETDILEDQASIKILDQSKDLARIVREKQEDSKAIETVIEDFRNKYTSVSSYAANLYSCIKQIQKLNCVYQFSLEWYMNLYYKSIILSEKSRDFNKRCEKIKESFLYHLYLHAVHSLFRRDKLIFLFFLTLNVLKSNNTIDDEEIQFFIKIDQNSTDCNEYSFDSISKKVNELTCLTNFQEFLSKFDSISWRIYLEAPYLLDIPAPWNVTLSSFQKLILTKLLKPNYLYLHIQNFITEVLGEKFTATPHYNITDTFNESYCLSPILFISTTEFNPSKSLSFLAEKKKVLHCFKTLTFGENETAKATLLMNEARVKGSWLLLQNCHLSTNWFELLEKNLTDMDFDNTHENFRLWLTCESVENIPLELLQNSIKVVVDSPKGFKQNLKRLYMNQPICEPEFFSGCPGKHAVFTKLLYGLASFHCALQCRVEFGEFGWKKPFIFDDSDFQVSLQQLQMVVNEEDFCLNNFEKIFYLIGSCHYGGYLEKRENISLVEILLMQFVNSEIGFNKNYLFNNLERYGLPKKCDHQDFLSYISKLPEKQNPEIYGMNEYNDALCNRKEAEHMLKTIFEASLVQRQQFIEVNEFTLITTIEDVLTNIPKRLEYKTRDNYVIHQEKVKYNNLLHILTESLQSLKQAIGGAKFISPDEEGMAEDILKFTVPKQWLNVAFVHEKNLPNFISMLRKRVDFFQNLAVTEKCFPLSAFFSPRTLICKAKLDFSVACGDTVENVDFTFDVLKDKSDITADGIVITELYMFGAKWDEDCGKILEAHSCVYNALPPILFSPVCKGVGENVNCYKFPVYQSVDMKDLITFIPLETSATKEHWIKRGVRIFCQI